MSGQGAVPELTGVGSAVTKGDLAVDHLEDALVADSHAKDIGSQVFEGVLSASHRLAVDDPVLLPHRRWDLCKAVRFGLAQSIAELGADDLGECFDGQDYIREY